MDRGGSRALREPTKLVPKRAITHNDERCPVAPTRRKRSDEIRTTFDGNELGRINNDLIVRVYAKLASHLPSRLACFFALLLKEFVIDSIWREESTLCRKAIMR